MGPIISHLGIRDIHSLLETGRGARNGVKTAINMVAETKKSIARTASAFSKAETIIRAIGVAYRNAYPTWPDKNLGVWVGQVYHHPYVSYSNSYRKRILGHKTLHSMFHKVLSLPQMRSLHESGVRVELFPLLDSAPVNIARNKYYEVKNLHWDKMKFVIHTEFFKIEFRIDLAHYYSLVKIDIDSSELHVGIPFHHTLVANGVASEGLPLDQFSWKEAWKHATYIMKQVEAKKNKSATEEGAISHMRLLHRIFATIGVNLGNFELIVRNFNTFPNSTTKRSKELIWNPTAKRHRLI